MPPRKKKNAPQKNRETGHNAIIDNAGVVVEQSITETLKNNYMPYAISVIVSRAIPEIDGFKPAHRKLLYTMYKMGLLSGVRTKSANVVGQTMRLNPHGDAAIYETLVRLSRGNEALLHPYVDSKGNFGKAYSRDMAYAASRYTEVKLDPICRELFADIDKDTVDFIDNYDNTMKEPTLLPAAFPSVLVNANTGIAVGMASSICSFNLAEICHTVTALVKDSDADITRTLLGPDFSGGGILLYDEESIEKIYQTGRGSFRIRSVYNYNRENNCIEIIEIPPTTTVEAIMDKVAELVKAGKLKEISDMRDETDLNGLKLTIDLKRGTDPDKLMQRLYRSTPLEDSFACNFNVLIAGTPMVLGVRDIIFEWLAFRESCVKRRLYHELCEMRDKLHLLYGLEKILLDIDRAVKIIRQTESESMVIPNLMKSFSIDSIQAGFVADIRLRQLNREYILKRISEINSLKEQIEDTQNTLSSDKLVRKVITDELALIEKKYARPRRTRIYRPTEEDTALPEADIPDYPVSLFFTKAGYFKKITLQSLRMSGEQRLKEGDEIIEEISGSNSSHLLFFTNLAQVYKARASDFDDGKASIMGDFIAAKLSMDEGELPVFMAVTSDYSGYIVFFFENGKAAKVELSSYATKNNRRKLTSAYSAMSPLVAVYCCSDSDEFLLTSSSGRMLIVKASSISLKSTRVSQGVTIMTLKKGAVLTGAVPLSSAGLQNPKRFYAKSIPSAGVLPKLDDISQQLSL
ncbi:MAG: hypothetical protein K6E42_09530 [Synergistes sp.]|nr:hypothetical protein [Synergistes sp.]